MKIDDQVCTMAQAKRLKELGIIVPLHFFWWYTGLYENDMCQLISGFSSDKGPLYFPAFTVAELGEMMPVNFSYQDRQCFVTSEKYPNSSHTKWICGIHTVWAHDKPVIAKKYCLGRTEADCRAALLIYLLETKVISTESVNEMLKKLFVK